MTVPFAQWPASTADRMTRKSYEDAAKDLLGEYFPDPHFSVSSQHSLEHDALLVQVLHRASNLQAGTMLDFYTVAQAQLQFEILENSVRGISESMNLEIAKSAAAFPLDLSSMPELAALLFIAGFKIVEVPAYPFAKGTRATFLVRGDKAYTLGSHWKQFPMDNWTQLLGSIMEGRS